MDKRQKEKGKESKDKEYKKASFLKSMFGSSGDRDLREKCSETKNKFTTSSGNFLKNKRG